MSPAPVRTALVFAGVMYTTWLTHVVMDAERLVSFVSDDAFYYLQVADNIVAGNGSSFDTLNETNGYHPLWMLILVPLRWAFSDLNKITFLRLVLSLQALLTVATVTLLWRSLRSSLGAVPALVGIVLFSVSFFSPVTGLETALVSFGMALAVWLVVTDRSVVWVGLSLVIISLGRIDYSLVGIALGSAWVWMQAAKTQRITVGTVLTLATKVFALPLAAGLAYVFWNRLVFGHFLPVTHAIKTAADPRFDSSTREVVTAYGSRIVLAPVLVLPLFHVVYRLKSHQSTDPVRPIDLAAVCLGIGSLTHMGYLLLTVSFGPARWHLIPHGVSYAVVTAHATNVLTRSMRVTTRVAIQRVAVALLCLASLATNLRMVSRVVDPPASNPSVQLHRTALWLDQHTSAEAIVGLSDAGIVGYFSERRVVNLDGLVNSFETYERIRDDGLCRELDETWDIDYFASIVPPSNRPGYESLRLDLPGWARTTRVTVNEPAELFRSKQSGAFTIVVWDYDELKCTANVLAD